MNRLTHPTSEGIESSSSLDVLLKRLAQYEDMHEAIYEENKRIEAELESLRHQDKSKTARFREAFGRKLMHQNVILWFKKFQLDTDEQVKK